MRKRPAASNAASNASRFGPAFSRSAATVAAAPSAAKCSAVSSRMFVTRAVTSENQRSEEMRGNRTVGAVLQKENDRVGRIALSRHVKRRVAVRVARIDERRLGRGGAFHINGFLARD